MDTYRNYLQSAANRGDVNAHALLQIVGDDGRLDDTFSSNGVNLGGNFNGSRYNISAADAANYNNKYYTDYQHILGAGTTDPNRLPTTTNDPSTNPAVFDQAIGNTQQAIDRLDNQLRSGYSSIDSSYQDALNQLLLNKNRANETYNQDKLSTGQDFVGAKNTIGSQAGQTLNGLRRLLGSRGAGGGSAYNISAPDAVSRQATIQRNEATDTFGENNQALDSNWNNFLTDYGNEVSGAKSQKEQKRQELESSINSNRANLLQTIAQLTAQKAQAAGGTGVVEAQPFLDQANSILNNLSNYQVKPIEYKTNAYKAPDLSKYTINPNAAPQFQGQQQTNDYTSPYLAALLGKKKQPAV